MSTRLSRHTLLLLISNAGGAALSFALTVLIARMHGEEGLGAYAVALAWIFPLSMLVDFGLASLATRDVAQLPATGSAYLEAMAVQRIVVGGLVAAALIASAPLLASEPAAVAGLIVSAPLVVILPLYSSFTAVFKALGAMWPIPWLNIGMLAAQVGLTALVFAHGGSVVEALAVNTCTSFGQLVAAWALWRVYFARRVKRQSHPSPKAQWTRLMRRAWPFALAALLAAIQMRSGLILLERLTTTADAGAFAAANRLVEAARLIPNAFFGALFPALASLAGNPNSLRQTFKRALVALSAFGITGFAVSLVLEEEMIGLVFGVAFTPAAAILPPLMLALLFGVLRGAYTLYWYAQQGENRVNKVNALIIVVQVALSLWAIPAYGPVGLAGVLVVVEALGLALLWRVPELPPANAELAQTRETAERRFIVEQAVERFRRLYRTFI